MKAVLGGGARGAGRAVPGLSTYAPSPFTILCFCCLVPCLAEGISYLVVVGLCGWSIYTKVSTGSGLPPGPSGLLGAVEGISYLSLVGAIAVFAANAAGL